MASRKDRSESRGKRADKAAGKGTRGVNRKVAPLRAKDTAALREELIKLRREQFNLRMQRATGQPAKPDQWAKVRRNIARVKTVLAEQAARAGAAAVAAAEAGARR